MYIDESGDHKYHQNYNGIKDRYLSLTGFIISNKESLNSLDLKVREIQRMFAIDPDSFPVLHLEDIIASKGDFAILHDEKQKEEFNKKIVELYENVDFKIVTVTINKEEHFAKYGQSALHPYHYTISVLMERYIIFLESVGGKGDVMVEARGKTEDRLLESIYSEFCNSGNQFFSSSRIITSVTSKNLKIKNKKAEHAGLQMADMLALPSKIDILFSFGILKNLSENFNKKIINILQSKYLCKEVVQNKQCVNVKGWGKKLL